MKGAPFLPAIPQRLRNLPSQFFAKLVHDTVALQAQGHDVIALGQGNPDQPTPEHIVEAARTATLDPKSHRYPPFSGLGSLKEAAATWYQRTYGVTLDPQREICIVIGTKIGLEEISLCYLEPGDVALVPDPGYPDYLSGIALAGGRSVGVPLTAASHFLPDFAAVSPANLAAAKLLFLNYPSNPTGQVASPDVFDEAIRLAERHGFVIAHDLAYGDLVFDGRTPVSFLQQPGAMAHGVEFVTLSKSYNMAGWRIGFVAGNQEVIARLNLIQDHLHCSQFGAVQVAAAAALSGPQDSVWALRDLYQTRRDTWVAGCRSVGWEVTPSAGTFYVWCKVPAGFTSESFAKLLLEQAHVVVAPGNGFGSHGEGYVRVSLTAPTERVAEATRRIGSALHSIR